VPPLLLRHEMANAVCVWPVSVQVCPGWPRMVRLPLDDVALCPLQENCTLLFEPNGFAVIELLPGVTFNPALEMPHAPPHE